MGLETAISGLMVVITILKDIPSVLVATSDAKRILLAKELYRITISLDDIIRRGNEILVTLDEALAYDDARGVYNRLYDSVYENPHAPELTRLVNLQIISLRDLDWSTKRIMKVLDIFSPGVPHLIYETIIPKQGVLRQILGNVSNGEVARRRLIVKDVLGQYDLKISEQRRLYLSQANARLSQLIAVRQNLINFLQTHYEPHHLT